MSFNWWILTIPHANYTEYLPPQCDYIRGQLELGDTGYLHWQLVCHTIKKIREPALVKIFGPYHVEPTRSAEALNYVWKEQTRVAGTSFELGRRPMQRNSDKDWETVRNFAKCGQLDEIPPDIYVRCYNQVSIIFI